MIKIYSDIIQGSDEWHALRSTRFTASNFHKLFAKETTKTYQNCINEVVFARLTGEVEEGYQSEYMKRGIDLEPEAIDAYENLTFNKVNRVGFVEFDEWIGCSPDGLIDERGMIQIKCPKATTLMDYYSDGGVEEYMIQLQGELFVANKEWTDFFVYHPKLKPILRRVKRIDNYQEQIKLNLATAIVVAKKRIGQIKAVYR